MICPLRCLMSVFLSSAIHTSYPQTCYRWLFIIYEEKNWSTSFWRDFFSHYTWGLRNGTRLFTLQGAICHQGLNFLQFSGFGVWKPTTKLFLLQTSAEKEKKGRMRSRVWPGSSDWGKHGRAEDSWGEVERAAESQVWRRRPCKGGRTTRLQACQDFVAIVAISWKPFLVENFYFKALTYLGDCQKCSLLIFRKMLRRLASTSLNAARGFSTSVARLI